MWSVKKLQELAAERGETIPRDTLLEEALLAQERFYGRAERSYDRPRALLEMNRLLDRIEDFPRSRVGEFRALKQLRAYAEERAVQLAEQRRLEKEEEKRALGESVRPAPQRTPEEHEEEDEMGM